MNSSEITDWKEFKIKRAGTCITCGIQLPIGVSAIWSPSHHVIACISHLNELEKSEDETDSSQTNSLPRIIGTAGNSAHHQAEKRTTNRENRINSRFPRMGKFILAVTDEPQSTQAWERGAKGEIKVGKFLEKIASENKFGLIHDRQIPNSKANIDHIAITQSGIYVIDAKNYEGEIRIVDKSGFFADPDPKLYVGSRNCMSLVQGMHKQVDVVRNVIKSYSLEIPVKGVLAFYAATWAQYRWSLGQVDIEGVLINSKGLESIVTKHGDLTTNQIAEITEFIGKRLKPAI